MPNVAEVLQLLLHAASAGGYFSVDRRGSEAPIGLQRAVLCDGLCHACVGSNDDATACSRGRRRDAGPTFEYIHFEHGVSKESQLEELCKQAQKTNDGLDRILSIITTLPDMTEM